ncbi:sensor histidine kinase [Candidatus Pelagibacter sp. HIMB1517]|uniref:sensor histidine kinase n=1 Tax=Candidatus Pelagibacter sp. HIMB1517 TaxID=3413341 RepID=UPI003F83B89E
MKIILIFNFLALVLLFFFGKLELISLVILCISNSALLYFASKIKDQKIKRKKNTEDLNVINSSKVFTAEDLENQLINQIEDYILFINSFNTISAANQAAKSYYGDVIGKDLSSFIRAPDLLDKIENSRNRRINEYLEFEINLPTYSFFRLTIVPLSQKNVLLVVKDYTDFKKSEKLRSDFVANVSHELKTPLVSIKGFLETISSSAKDDPVAQQKFIKIMQEQADKMEILISDLMSLSRIEMQEHVQPNSKVNINEIFESLERMPNKLAEKKCLDIKIVKNDTIPLVRGDYDKISEVVQNLYDNAIKYTKDHSAVELFLHKNEDKLLKGSVSIHVKDQGIGIPKDEIHRVTERFFRTANAKKNLIQGTGLGLAIVKHIINQHRGDLEINSRLNEGTEFIVHLPIYEKKD